jgi:hypothetical protein
MSDDVALGICSALEKIHAHQDDLRLALQGNGSTGKSELAMQSRGRV